MERGENAVEYQESCELRLRDQFLEALCNYWACQAVNFVLHFR